MSRLLLVSASAWLLAAVAHAQSPSLPHYKVLSVDKVTGENLTRVASEGYRIAERGGRVAASFMVFERSTGAYEYLVSDALQEDLGKVPPGYRILPHTVGPGRRGLCAAIFERAPGDRVTRDYRIEREGFRGVMGILTVPISLRKGIAKAATDGYRVIAVGGNCAVLEQRPNDAAREPDGTPPRYQLVVAAEWAPNQSWVPRLERKLNEAALRGYHLIRGGVSIKRGHDVVAVMEKREAPLVEYRVLSAVSERGFAAPSWRALEQEFLAAGEQGWEYVALTGTTGQQPEPEWDSGRLFPSTVRAIVLERPAGRR